MTPGGGIQLPIRLSAEQKTEIKRLQLEILAIVGQDPVMAPAILLALAIKTHRDNAGELSQLQETLTGTWNGSAQPTQITTRGELIDLINVSHGLLSEMAEELLFLHSSPRVDEDYKVAEHYRLFREDLEELERRVKLTHEQFVKALGELYR